MEKIKSDMANYWTKRVDKFSALRAREFAGEKHGQWLVELVRYLPKGRQLNILDIGTGTGFFAFLLAEQGHRVTGIDLTPGMITEAKRLSGLLGLSVGFAVMDGECPAFPAGSFDVIVTRKLTWTLPHLPMAYANWYNLLKPGGVLINFDADYCRENNSAPLPAKHAHQEVGSDLMAEYERMKGALRLRQQPRPQWDVELLKQAGFRKVRVDTGVWGRIYREFDEFYDPTPGFALVATR